MSKDCCPRCSFVNAIADMGEDHVEEGHKEEEIE